SGAIWTRSSSRRARGRRSSGRCAWRCARSESGRRGGTGTFPCKTGVGSPLEGGPHLSQKALGVSQHIVSCEAKQGPAQRSKCILSQQVLSHRSGFPVMLAVVLDAQACIHIREVQTRHIPSGIVPNLMLEGWWRQAASSQQQPEASLHGRLGSNR